MAVRVQRHAAVQLEQHVVGRAVDVREERYVRRRRHARDGAEIMVGLRRRAGGIAAVGQAVGIEFLVAVGPVPALVGNRAGLLAVGVDLDRLASAPLPELRFLGAAPGEREVARRRHGDLDLAVRHLVVELPAAVGILPQDGAVGERGGDFLVLARVPVLVHHEKQGRAVGIGHVPIFALVAPFVGQDLVVAPAPELASARERVVQVHEVGNAQVAELPERPRVGVARERAAAFAERFGLPVAVGVDVRQPFAGQVDRVVQVLVVGHGVVVALGVIDAQRLAELDALDVVGRLQQAQIPPRQVVQGLVRLGVQQAHAGGEVVRVRRRLAHVLAEHHQRRPRQADVEHARAVVFLAEAARLVELPLRLADVAGGAAVLVGRPLLAEEIGRHVLDRVQAQAVHLGDVHQPADRAHHVAADVFLVEVRIGRDDVRSDIRAAEAHVAQRGMPVVEFRVVRMAHEGNLGMGVAFGGAEVGVGRFMGDVDEAREVLVLHLPGVAPVFRVVPRAVETVFRRPQVEIFRQHAGIDVDRRVLVVAGNVERAVVHDVVEVDPQAEAVGRVDQPQQFFLGAVARAAAGALRIAAEVEGIPQVVAHGEIAAGLLRRRQPKRGEAVFGDFGNLGVDLLPAHVEELEHDFRAGARDGQRRQEESDAQDSPPSVHVHCPVPYPTTDCPSPLGETPEKRFTETLLAPRSAGQSPFPRPPRFFGRGPVNAPRRRAVRPNR